jgi:hypothetical protein
MNPCGQGCGAAVAVKIDSYVSSASPNRLLFLAPIFVRRSGHVELVCQVSVLPPRLARAVAWQGVSGHPSHQSAPHLGRVSSKPSQRVWWRRLVETTARHLARLNRWSLATVQGGFDLAGRHAR